MKAIQKELNVIEAVVMPLKIDAMERAEKYAREAITEARKELSAADNDIHKVAPYPSGASANFHGQLAKYRFFTAITKWRDNQRVGLNTPCFVDVDSNYVAKYVKEAREDAAFQYEAFVAKLNKKIGPAKTARLDGNHVWSHSFLHVVTESGDAQIWKTQTIMNQSKLGKIFPQFPTRKVKMAHD